MIESLYTAMSEVHTAYAVMMSLVAGLTFLGLFTEFRYRRPLMIGLFLVLIGGSLTALLGALSHPRHVDTLTELDRPDAEEAVIVGVDMIQGKGIYLLLKWDGAEYPRYFVYPWDDEMAQQLQDAIERNAQEGGEGVIMELPFDRSLEERESPFHPIPQPRRMAPKPPPEQERHDWQHQFGPGEEA